MFILFHLINQWLLFGILNSEGPIGGFVIRKILSQTEYFNSSYM